MLAYQGNAAEVKTSAAFSVFRFLLGGSAFVQLPLARKRNSVPFLEAYRRVEIYYLTFSTRRNLVHYVRGLFFAFSLPRAE